MTWETCYSMGYAKTNKCRDFRGIVASHAVQMRQRTARTKIPGKRMDRRLNLQVLLGRRQDEKSPLALANECSSVDDSHYMGIMRTVLI